MANTNLFEEFEPTTKQTWLHKIEQDLKGKSLKSLARTTRDGIEINPVYFAEEASPKAQPLKEHPKWDAVQEILVTTEKEANALALDNLNRGATSLLFYLQGQEDLTKLLQEIEIEYICLNLVTANHPQKLAQQLNTLIKKRGLDPLEIEGSINYDPLENLARTGNWFTSKTEDFKNLKECQTLLQKGVKGICVNANIFANAGATEAQQLGIALAMSYEYLHQLELKSTRGFWLNLAVGADFFAEIAKLRALRRLWQKLQTELDLPTIELRLYAETALRNKTISDRYNNLIRTTSESMAAVIGGATEVSVKAFNLTFESPTFFGERIAKNQQSILQHESHFQKVRDMAAGSYFLEDLTEKMAEKGWQFFKEIEVQGGYINSLNSGWLQATVKAAADQEQADFNLGKKVLVGANKYLNTTDDLANIVKQGLFWQAPKGDTVVKPFVTKRLSEEIEKETLGNKL